MTNPRVEFYETENEDRDVQDHRWRLIAANGEIVASGEAHSSRRDAERAFKSAAACMAILTREAEDGG